ncbi:MAG: hypothetical protein LBF97_00875, partial [Elusimicrobiota bacterium]|nr:hypothetical protein [Elusimicrobiota bacterium]
EEEGEFLQLIEKCFYIKKETKNNFIPLIYEGELGGLNFKDKTFSFYSKPKKRTGRKSALVPDVFYESIERNL